MKPYNTLALTLGILLLLPGCGGNILDWADETFYQGKVHKDYEKAVKPFLKSVRLYDQFDTLAIFDGLWLSDSVRTAYAQVYAKMMGKSESEYVDFLRRELSANTYFVSFYVLSMKSIPLTEIPPLWAVHLEVNGKKYLPAEIKCVELSAEYASFFGKRMNNHKEAYEIRFDRKDVEGADIIEGKHEMKLFFSSPRHYGVMQWNIDEDSTVVLPAFVPIADAPEKEEILQQPVKVEKVSVRNHRRAVSHDKATHQVAVDKEDQHQEEDSLLPESVGSHSNKGGAHADISTLEQVNEEEITEGSVPTGEVMVQGDNEAGVEIEIVNHEEESFDGGVGGGFGMTQISGFGDGFIGGIE
jgi:hypothetical protein